MWVRIAIPYCMLKVATARAAQIILLNDAVDLVDYASGAAEALIRLTRTYMA